MTSAKRAAVEYGDVAEAAVKLMIAGHRPTVRGVRDLVGRGSPNTIAPLLTAWFAQLGMRLASDPQLRCQVMGRSRSVPITSVWALGSAADTRIAPGSGLQEKDA